MQLGFASVPECVLFNFVELLVDDSPIKLHKRVRHVFFGVARSGISPQSAGAGLPLAVADLSRHAGRRVAQ